MAMGLCVQGGESPSSGKFDDSYDNQTLGLGLPLDT